MTLVVDIVIVLILAGALSAGIRSGLFATLGTLVGLAAGALAAPWVLPLVASAITDERLRGVAVLGTLAGLLLIGAMIGSGLGSLIRRGADRLRLRILERVLGGALGLVVGLVVVSLAGSGLSAASIPQVSAAVASSRVLRVVDEATPAPVDEALARLRAALAGGIAMPTIDGSVPQTAPSGAPALDTVDLDDPALARAARSVARVSGAATGCGTISSGSGFVVAEDRVVTNAHVVAGVESPLVELPGEDARDGTVVYFDPVDDLAVVAVDVDAAPLPLDDSLAPGDGAVLQGYPYGGPFSSASAVVTGSGTTLVDDIYGGAGAERSVYSLRAQIVPGNSGGPLLTSDGGVAGVVFARSESDAGIGYAMTTAELLPVIAQLDQDTAPVSTGACEG